MKNVYLTSLAFLFAGTGLTQTASQTFTTSGTFTVPPDVTTISIEVIGAGGDGGFNGGGGGGGGGYAMGSFSVVPGSVLNVTVGVNGGGPTVGTTSVDALISATGGANGTSGSGTSGGAPGVGTGGFTNRTGGTGGNGTYTYFGGGGGGAGGPSSNGGDGGSSIPWTGVCITPGGIGGTTGGLPGGAGGKGAGFTDASCNDTDPSENGFTYGGGGGGGNGNGGLPGEGADGYCVISWCDINLNVTQAGMTLTSDHNGAISYQWVDCDNAYAPVPGEDNQSYNVIIHGNYAVVIEDGDCIDTSECIVTSLGFEEWKKLDEIKVFPNPFTNKIQVTNTTGNESYVLMNMAGQIVWTGTAIEKYDFAGLPSENYTLKIQSGNVVRTLTLMKK